MNEAFKIAKSDRPGPVVVDLPMDVQRDTISKMPVISTSTKTATLLIDDSTIDKTIELLLSSKQPIILCGQGILLSRAHEELRSFVNFTQIHTSCSLLGLGAISTQSEFSLGYHGHTGNQTANKAIHESDLLIVLGSRLDIRQTGSVTDKFVPNGKVIHIDLDVAELENPRVHTELKINADVKDFLTIINKKIKNKHLPDWSNWHNKVIEWKRRFKLDYSKETLKPQYVIETVNKLTNQKSLVCVTGVGSHQQWTARHFDFDFPNRVLLTSGGHGAMGFDLPTAIGAQLSSPDSLVLCIVGDGSIQMNIQELATIANYNLPIKIIVIDNQRLAIVSQFQKITWGKDPSCGNVKNPDFASIANAYGIFGDTVSDSEQVKPKLQKLLSHNGPSLLHCLVDPNEDVVPMLLGGQTMDSMWPYD
jgi:acetolactate synthase-1/2/3 large subunit